MHIVELFATPRRPQRPRKLQYGSHRLVGCISGSNDRIAATKGVSKFNFAKVTIHQHIIIIAFFSRGHFQQKRI